MNLGLFLWKRLLFVWICVVFGMLATVAAAKPIRLQNRTIEPDAAKGAHAVGRPDNPVAGLFLVQFNGPLVPQWRAELEKHRIQLLRFVPQDAFVARLNGVRLQEVEKLPFVAWVEPFRSDDKMHRSIQNDAARQNGVHETPVRFLLAPDATPQEIARTRRFLKTVERESSTRFGHIVQGRATPAQLRALSESPSVLWIEPAPKIKLFDEISSKITGGDDGLTGTPTITQQLGFDGSGVTVAVADSGLHEGDAETMHPDLAGRAETFFYYGTLTDASDEHSHGTHVTGIIAGDASTGEADVDGYLYGLGVAPGADIITQRLFDGIGNYEAPPSFEVLTHDAVRAGADIGSNSWGDDTQGRYDLSAAEFDALVRDADNGTPGDQPYILEFSAGNAGPGEQTIGSPAVAKNVIASGAVENNRFEFFIYDSGQETMADFSSRGPCEDGRIKPDVVAPGTWIASLRSSLADDDNAWSPISHYYMYQGGTSQSGPHVSGAAAVFVQYYRETVTNSTPSPALVKAALINCALDIDDGESTGPVPNNQEGWGRVDLAEIIDSPRSFQFVDQTTLLTNAQTYEKRVLVGSMDEPLKITLTYTDVPGFPAAIPALVNDLDLEVIAPNGAVYRGNQFEEGESVAGVPSFDSINNVEAVHLFTPVPGEYIIRVHARNIVEDSRGETPPIDQDFALVISAVIPHPGEGIVFFDRSAFTVPSQATLKLIDPDLAAQQSVSIQVASSSDTIGKTLVLNASSAGVFTGTVALVTGTATAGELQVSHGDTLQAIYQDASPAGTRTGTARVDLIAPVITNVSVTNRFGRMVVLWQTDEPADSAVMFGTNGVLSTTTTNARFVYSHEMQLENLVVGATYEFFVTSTDAAGNTRTNNNSGTFFSFVAQPPAVILLVDSYTDQFFAVPPLTGYTQPLDAIGIPYQVWSVPDIGSPTFNDLKPFDVVIWRVSEFQSGVLSPSEQTAITNYLSNGGSLFIASMEATTRLDESSAGWFRTNVLRVLSYTEDVGVPAVLGSESDPVSSGIDVQLDYTEYEDDFKVFVGLEADVSDTLQIAPDASPLFFQSLGNEIVGLRYPRIGQDSPGRVVYLSFPLDTVPMSGPAPNNRPDFLRNIIRFLTPGLQGIGTIALDNSVYTIPSLVTIEVADADIAGTGQITVTFSSDMAPGGQTITLNETIRPGLFRGFITLVAHTNSFVPGELRVQNGDEVRAEYSDASAGDLKRTSARVDTTPPVITGIHCEPDYEGAVVTWITSKPADALVQFGESSLLNRTGYTPEMVTTHSVQLRGLQPDKTYVYQVVSRDHAGNTTTDNNGGNFYTFRTLTPLGTPWSDNMENGATNWLVFDSDDSETTWELGVPNNGWETAAHSPTDAWGSNLNGDNISQAETFLISPAILLAGGDKATLRFWHSYDFIHDENLFDILHGGTVYILLNDGESVEEVAVYTDIASDGWEEATIDLTRFVGRVVRVVFHFVLFSIENGNRAGWLIDDVSIAVTNTFTGTIQITNNLAQSHFDVTGPVSFTGSGWNTLLTNAPFGQYTVTFGSVPFYDTPTAQTQTLTNTGPVTFAGTYTFADSNGNGISDAWEMEMFGEVSGSRTQFTDSDGDGSTDYAEFLAGTDPSDATSSLRFSEPLLLENNGLQLSWRAATNRAYQVQGSVNAIIWEPVSSWLIATNTNSVHIVPPLTNGAPYLFRLEVRP